MSPTSSSSKTLQSRYEVAARLALFHCLEGGGRTIAIFFPKEEDAGKILQVLEKNKFSSHLIEEKADFGYFDYSMNKNRLSGSVVNEKNYSKFRGQSANIVFLIGFKEMDEKAQQTTLAIAQGDKSRTDKNIVYYL